MGGSIGLALKAGGHSARILGIGRNAEKLETARNVGAIDAYETDLARGVAECDILVLCTTIVHIVEQLPLVLRSARPDAVITDIGSTKSAIVDAAEGDPRFIGGHPMCGSEKTGVEAARANLYHRATWAITPDQSTSEKATSTLLSLIEATGAVPLTLDPVVHDTMVALTSHLPHVMASALMRQASTLREEIPTLPRMAAGSFADMTRVAASHPSIWRDVCLTNRDAVLKAIADYRKELSVIEEAVASGDAAAIEAFFTAGETAKKAWPPRG
jgi:prephenate dehydrogenase